MRMATFASITVLAVALVVALPRPSATVLACSPSNLTFDEDVRDASLIAVVRLIDPHPSPSATPTPRKTALPTATPTPQFPRAATPARTREGANATFAAIVSAFATKTPFAGTTVPVIERVVAGREPGQVALPGDERRLGDVLANQRNDFGCGASNGGFGYAFGNRYLVFLRGQPDETPHYGNVWQLNQRDELGFFIRVSRGLYDAFFSDLSGSLTERPGSVTVYYSKISLDRLERAIHAIRSGSVRPPDTGSAGLASTHRR